VDTATGDILLDATAGSDAGIDVVSSEYATVAAEQTALENLTRVVADRIVTSVAVQMRKDAARNTSEEPKR
jgi:LPS-assembly lipoprotein